MSRRDISGRFLLHPFEDGAVVFDLTTGDTHALDWTAALLLRGVVGGQSADSLSQQAQVSSHFGISASEAAACLSSARLRLEKAGLLDSPVPE